LAILTTPFCDKYKIQQRRKIYDVKSEMTGKLIVVLKSKD